MSQSCNHRLGISNVVPQSLGCEDCMASGMAWVHLRLCRSCGHVGCCDNSPGRHATAHYFATAHPIIEGYDPPEGWGWCYVDEEFVVLPDQTPRRGPIPRFCDGL
ncbi:MULTISPECIES: UBP-type zinc finger domain-containing protein [Rhizobium]|nr:MULTISPECIES: UBP-type zinc finger domain-containing protein [Rhizobium]